jgi:hypothetical protein
MSALTRAIIAALRDKTPATGRLFEGGRRTSPGQRFSTLPSDDPSRDPAGPQNIHLRSPRGGGPIQSAYDDDA